MAIIRVIYLYYELKLGERLGPKCLYTFEDFAQGRKQRYIGPPIDKRTHVVTET